MCSIRNGDFPMLHPRKPSMTTKKQPFEDVSPIENDDYFHCHVSFRSG